MDIIILKEKYRIWSDCWMQKPADTKILIWRKLTINLHKKKSEKSQQFINLHKIETNFKGYDRMR